MTTQAIIAEKPVSLTSSAERMQSSWYADESEHVKQLIRSTPLDQAARGRISANAAALVKSVRAVANEQGVLDAFMSEYDLSSEEGVVLMCLAEALLRIPDDETAERLIADKLGDADWEAHLGKSSSIFVNASTWGLMLTGKLVKVGQSTQRNFGSVLGKLANRSGEPVVRLAIRQAMKIMGHQFVMGRNIDEALSRSRKRTNRNYRYSFDMLGEAALTATDAERYLQAYHDAIKTIGKSGQVDNDIYAAPSISVKLSALHPRYEVAQRERVMRELPARLLYLAEAAAKENIALTVDAEEADRLMLSLDVFAEVAASQSIAQWQGLGLAIQAYQKRCWYLLDYLAELARQTDRRFPVRLVKGAYWDTEIKLAQMEGWPGYPVFTRKVNTDISYLACASRLLADRTAFYPQFATHNAHTIAAIGEMAGERLDFEYQRLHGMGEDLYEQVARQSDLSTACRVYAPVGSHEDLLPYLVRRLLENGANTSFVNRISDQTLSIAEVISDPYIELQQFETIVHPQILQPKDLYGKQRRNSAGINLASELTQATVKHEMETTLKLPLNAQPIVAGQSHQDTLQQHTIVDPARPEKVVGYITNASEKDVESALRVASEAYIGWHLTPLEQRADSLDRAADMLQKQHYRFMAMAVCEAGKSLPDAVAEVREAVDFLRYYAMQARADFNQPRVLTGPTGEHNQIALFGRGVFVCISPWNFPLAIFVGQVAAALVAGNCVIAKPAEETPFIAAAMVDILHQAGIPKTVLHYLPGEGATVGAQLTADNRVAGVAFTGSTETAHLINAALAGRKGALPVFIAETGGQNTMLVDSSALPEQVIQDVITSAFHSAGQRCSALRVLYLQDEVADHMLAMLAGAMQELKVGFPGMLNTDVGPVINQAALDTLVAHEHKLNTMGRLIAKAPLPDDLSNGYFFAPCAYEIDSIEQLEREVFGPVLHVIRYASRDLKKVITSINNSGYGLTLGIHSRIESTQRYIAENIRVGNTYVNRNMTGAVVGVQPFGGEGLSGTGPKAGGPHYLHRFATERTLTVNTAAVGGNASLLELSD